MWRAYLATTAAVVITLSFPSSASSAVEERFVVASMGLAVHPDAVVNHRLAETADFGLKTVYASGRERTDSHPLSNSTQRPDCGDCWNYEYPLPPHDDVHRFEDPEWFDVACSGGGGHYAHDCDDGDQTGMYTPGTCDTHMDCIGDNLLALVGNIGVLEEGGLKLLLAEYSNWLTYDRTKRHLTIRNCTGQTISVVKVIAAGVAIKSVGLPGISRNSSPSGNADLR